MEGGNIKTTIITIGNGGYNIAADCITSGIFSDYKLIVCDSDTDDLKRNYASAAENHQQLYCHHRQLSHRDH